jgi:hypothetical protein
MIGCASLADQLQTSTGRMRQPYGVCTRRRTM